MSTTTATRTRTRTDTALLEVVRDGPRSVVRTLRSRTPLGLRQLADRDDGAARVAIVQTAACLVCGDDVRLEVCVEEGATLVLSDISATLCHPVAAGSPGAVQRITITVADGGHLHFAEQPLILAAGTRLDRMLRIALTGSASAVHHDTLVLGRHGEQPGAARLRLRVTRDELPILDDGLSTEDLHVLRSAAVLGSARVVGSLGLYGTTAPSPLPEDAFVLSSVDTLVRRLTANVADLSGLDGLFAEWSCAASNAIRAEGG